MPEYIVQIRFPMTLSLDELKLLVGAVRGTAVASKGFKIITGKTNKSIIQNRKCRLYFGNDERSAIRFKKFVKEILGLPCRVRIL